MQLAMIAVWKILNVYNAVGCKNDSTEQERKQHVLLKTRRSERKRTILTCVTKENETKKSLKCSCWDLEQGFELFAEKVWLNYKNEHIKDYNV